ncbi:MAG: PSD1 domain-containing protein [Planctomycetes bacterium]|nr:PSD1 domain-containing protein [Planctomycetota bacterium]
MKNLTLLASSLVLFGLSVAAAQEREPGQAFEALRRRLDTDLDGKIGESEFPRGRAAFRRLDRDRDGFLTAADFARDAEKPATTETKPEREPTAEEVAFFESKVRPVLASNCYECHSATASKLRAGLRVDGLEHLLAGGASGPAIVPGNADDSLMIQAVRRTSADLEMPPKTTLAEDAVKDLERWVAMGAPWPRAKEGAAAPKVARAPLDVAKAREFWSFQPPKRATPPATKDATWAWTDADRFLLAAMEKAGVAPVADADDRTWLRRVTFDLTGLPPTPEELDHFDADRSPKRFEVAVDRLLASPAYGERWGRHWLDVARYAESSGKDSNVLYPQAWRYRDWVIAAFNADVPYDRFVTAQLAGDLLPAKDDDERAANLIATGYLALGAKSHTTRDRRQFQLDVADEQIDAVGQGLLGVTLARARCHDHKYDPIPIEDYYGLAGIFLSTETRFGTYRGAGNNQPSELVELPAKAKVPAGPRMEPGARAVLERLREQAKRTADAGLDEPRTRGEDERRKPGADGERKRPGEMAESDDPAKPKGAPPADDGAKKKPDGVDLFRVRTARETVAMLDDLLARFDEDGRALDDNKLAMGVVEGQSRDIAVLDRGELDKPGAIAPRGVPQVLRTEAASKIAKGSGRRELAAWIASKENPLTARVWANRVWLHLFGSGLVRTPENFGASGQAPDHPELLDTLALEFVAKGWSTKALVRELVLSHAYRLASTNDARHAKVDPDAITRWRMPDRRMEAESIRDAMLAVAGTLQRAPPVGSPAGTFEGVLRRDELVAQITRERPVRSVYLPMLRDHLPDALDAFDAPDPAFVTGDREETSVATQALFLMNDPDVLRTADAFAERLLAKQGSDDERIAWAFELAFGRAPSSTERSAVREFLKDFEKLAGKGAKKDDGERDRRAARERLRDRQDAGGPPPITDPRRAAWSAFAQSLFESAEFRSLG